LVSYDASTAVFHWGTGSAFVFLAVFKHPAARNHAPHSPSPRRDWGPHAIPGQTTALRTIAKIKRPLTGDGKGKTEGPRKFLLWRTWWGAAPVWILTSSRNRPRVGYAMRVPPLQWQDMAFAIDEYLPVKAIVLCKQTKSVSFISLPLNCWHW